MISIDLIDASILFDSGNRRHSLTVIGDVRTIEYGLKFKLDKVDDKLGVTCC